MTRGSRQRDLAPRIPLRRTQPKSSHPSALPGAAPAERLHLLLAAYDDKELIDWLLAVDVMEEFGLCLG